MNESGDGRMDIRFKEVWEKHTFIDQGVKGVMACHMQATRFALAWGRCKVRDDFQHASHLTDVQRVAFAKQDAVGCSTDEIAAAVDPGAKVVPFVNEMETCGPSAAEPCKEARRAVPVCLNRQRKPRAEVRPRATPYDRRKPDR